MTADTLPALTLIAPDLGYSSICDGSICDDECVDCLPVDWPETDLVEEALLPGSIIAPIGEEEIQKECCGEIALTMALENAIVEHVPEGYSCDIEIDRQSIRIQCIDPKRGCIDDVDIRLNSQLAQWVVRNWTHELQQPVTLLLDLDASVASIVA